MAGWIKVSETEPGWTASGWLFRCVLGVISNNIPDVALRSELREIDEENLGALDLTTRPADERDAVVAILRKQLLTAAEYELAHLPDLPGTLQVLHELVDLAARV
jgi:hypothetical protein